MQPRTPFTAFALIAVLLLLPHLFSSQSGENPLHIGLARVHSGDEPHYLVLINSLLLDGDLDLANNYAAVHRGSDQAGARFKGSALDHHTLWYEEGKPIRWSSRFETNPEYWKKDPQGTPQPTPQQGVLKHSGPRHEYSYHWPGLAFLLAPILFPFRNTTLLEPVALLCSWIAAVLALIAFVSLARSFTSNSRVIFLTALLVFVGSPIWHYGRSLFTEPYLLACSLGAYALFIRYKKSLTAGILVGVGILLKGSFAVLGLPLGAFHLLRKDWKGAIVYTLPPLLALTMNLWLCSHMFGSIFRNPQDWLIGDIFKGTFGLLFSPSHGLLPFSPVVLSALLGWPALFRKHGKEARILTAAFVLYFLLHAAYGGWHGGCCFGPRYLIPVLPFLFLGLLCRLEPDLCLLRKQPEICFLAVISLAINALGAIPYWHYWNTHPFTALLAH